MQRNSEQPQIVPVRTTLYLIKLSVPSNLIEVQFDSQQHSCRVLRSKQEKLSTIDCFQCKFPVAFYPIQCTHCKAIFCQECLNQYVQEQQSECPQCKAAYIHVQQKPIFFKLLKEDIKHINFMFKCKCKVGTGNQWTDYCSFWKHFRKCESRMYRCPFGCEEGKKMTGSELKLHLCQECQSRQFFCKQCKQEFCGDVPEIHICIAEVRGVRIELMASNMPFELLYNLYRYVTCRIERFHKEPQQLCHHIRDDVHFIAEKSHWYSVMILQGEGATTFDGENKEYLVIGYGDMRIYIWRRL